jgi:acyl-CoA reductase-like NAD-dependent aldehyde dehydrogenase
MHTPIASTSSGQAGHLAPELTRSLIAHITLSPEPHEQIAVRTPFSGAVLGHIPSGVEADVELAVNRARTVQPAWESRSFASRAAIFLRFHDLLLARQNEILDLIQLENGKARLHAFEEVLDTAVVSRYYARHAERILRPRRRKGALPLLTRTWELRRPVGVAGFIVPWNYPLNLAVTDALAALMAGNTAVLRPDPQTSFTAAWALALLRETGLPPDVLQLVTGEGPVIGPALAERVDYMMFTGSTRVGRAVAQQAAARLIGCSLELGGKNPMLVLADADLGAAVEGAIRGCFVGAGQVCISIERIYVHESLFERFVAGLAARAREMKIGPALDYSTEMGSLTSERQMVTVEEHVRDAVGKGATLVAGGVRRPDIGPLFYEPTILTGVKEDMQVFAEETFGPVVAVYPFSTEAQAIELANATRARARSWPARSGPAA